MQAILGGVEILMKRALGSHRGVVCSESARSGVDFPSSLHTGKHEVDAQ